LVTQPTGRLVRHREADVTSRAGGESQPFSVILPEIAHLESYNPFGAGPKT
jgi:hypothetical protein